jgi:hypothetical protein
VGRVPCIHYEFASDDVFEFWRSVRNVAAQRRGEVSRAEALKGGKRAIRTQAALA